MDPAPITLAEVLRRLGRVHELQGRPRQAARAWRRALALDPDDANLAARLRAIESELAAGRPAGSLPPARLLVLHASEEVEEFPLRRAETIIGAGPDCEIRLRNAGAAPRCARVRYREGRFWIENLDAPGGLHLDGEPVGEPRALAHGSLLRAGSCHLRFLTSR